MKPVGRPLQYACFSCCKSFKRPQMCGASDRFMTSEQLHAQHAEASQQNERPYKCPDCSGVTYFMGLDFKAPKRTDVKSWREVQAFILSGKVYYRGSQRAASEA